MSDERLKRPTGAERDSRAVSDRRVTEDREKTDPVRLKKLLDSFSQAHLNDLPAIPGYHVMWATTTNKADTIQGRLNAGYELVTAEDLPPGYQDMIQKTGDWPGAVGVNEMIALKLPQELYEAAMLHLHTTLPGQEDDKLRAMYDVLRDMAAQKKLQLFEGDGFRQV
jgi:hypothetical protein